MKKAMVVVLLFLAQLTTGQSIPKEEFAAHRSNLMEKLNGGAAVPLGAERSEFGTRLPYKFRQESDFFYLTGYNSRNAAAVILPGAARQYVLFVRQPSRYAAIQSGVFETMASIQQETGADTVLDIDDLQKELPGLLRGYETVYYKFDDKRIAERLAEINAGHSFGLPGSTADLRPVLGALRLVKSKTEQEQVQKAAEITCLAVKEVLRQTEPGMNESDLDALIEYVFRKNGAQRPGFSNIVAAGSNSTFIHYMKNDQLIKDGDLVLIDIGAEYNHYSGDVTRTFPANGKFSEKQKQIYEIVLKAQLAAIDRVAPGVSIAQLQETADNVIRRELAAIGFVTDDSTAWQHKIWMMHGLSHWLGLDVHDAGDRSFSRGEERVLQPGMIITVEPGLYFSTTILESMTRMWGRRASSEELESYMNSVRPVLEKYEGIGIRIEDDVLVTEEGHKVLSSAAPKTVADIEKAMRR